MKISNEQVKEAMEKNVDKSFEDYAKEFDTARKIVRNDLAVKLMEKDKALKLEQALEMAEKETPQDAMPELIRNLRISANYCGTMWNMLEAIRFGINEQTDILKIVFEKQINEWAKKEASNIKRIQNK